MISVLIRPWRCGDSDLVGQVQLWETDGKVIHLKDYWVSDLIRSLSPLEVLYFLDHWSLHDTTSNDPWIPMGSWQGRAGGIGCVDLMPSVH